MSNYDLKKYDKSNICKVYDTWPEIAKKSYQTKIESGQDLKNIEQVVFAGMGGSGTVGEILSPLVKFPSHVSVLKSQILPKTVNHNSLVIATSFSGDTYETLSVLQEAKRRGCSIIAFSSGGKMKDYCIKNGLVHHEIDLLHSPRASLPAGLYKMLKALGSQFGIRHDEILDSIKVLEETKKKINSNILSDKNPAIKLADWITGIPIIYYPLGLRPTALRFKNSIQENAKIHVIAEEVMEVCHNAIMSWEKTDNQKCILIRGTDDHQKTKERWDIIKRYFEKNNISFYELFSIRGNLLSKIVNLIYMLDFTSIYLAIKNSTDPGPIKSIDYIKEYTAKQ